MVDSLYINTLSSKLDSLENIIENQQISTTYYQSILDHQWALLQQQTAIFVGILIITLTLFSLVTWRLFYTRITKRITEIETKFDSLNQAVSKVELIESQLKLVNTTTIRNSYEAATDPVWKVIWHIRYCEAIFDNKTIEPLIIRLDQLGKEFDNLLKDTNLLQRLIKFENIGGLKNILRKLISAKDDKVSRVPAFILDKILNAN